jgi:membrane protease YdiL (CAAX protease family)
MRTSAFVTVCASAGALAVPLHAVATPVSALVAGLVGLLGLRVWRWSRLPSSLTTGASQGIPWLVRPVVSLGIGLIVGLLVLGVIRLAIEPKVPAIGACMAAAAAEPVWRRLLIIYVAAVGEELIFRLLLLSLFAGLAVRVFRLAGRLPNRNVAWVANGLSALAFAAVHLPAWSETVSLSPGLTLAVLSLNALGGVVFGYAFVNQGIVAAMWAHAGADCAIQLIGPLTG